MKYKLIGDNDYSNPVVQVLHNRGIINPDRYLHINNEVDVNYSKLKNIHRAVDCLIKHMKKEDEAYIQVDSDVDGYTSSAILIQYLNKIDEKYVKEHITYNLHSGKQHGIKADDIEDNIKLVIVPDAAVRLEEQEKLHKRGIDLIIIDHHDVEKDTEFAILVNNQLSEEFTSKQSVGIGMVLKFIEALDDKLKVNYSHEFMDLVALGHISDIADVRDDLVRYYINYGLDHISNKFLKELIDKQSFSIKGDITPTSMTFYIVPLLNACVRSGTQEEKENVFKALLGSDEKIYYKRKDRYDPIQKYMARELVNIKSRQNRIRDKVVKKIEMDIKENNLDQNKIIFVQGDKNLEKNFTGLISSKLSGEYKRPVMIGKPFEGNYIAGSIRGYEKGAIKDFKQLLNDTNLLEFVEGHPNAAGFKIKKDNINALIEKINTKYKDIDINVNEYDIDFLIPYSKFSNSFINDIYNHRYLWGHGLEEPKVLLTDVPFRKDDINLFGKTSKRLVMYGIQTQFIKFGVKEDKFNELFSDGETFYIDMIGRCNMNEWNGNQTPQIVVEEMEVKDVLYF